MDLSLLDDYLTTGSTVFGINLGEEVNKLNNDVIVDYVGSPALKELVSSKVYVPETTSNRRAISQTIKFAKKVFEEENYDLMHINISQISVLKQIDRELRGIPVVYTQHTSTILGRFSLTYKEFAQNLSNSLTTEVVCPSQFMKSIWSTYTEMSHFSSVSVIPNGVVKYDNDHVRLVDPKDSDYLIAVGRVEPSKNMVEVVRFCEKYNHKLIVIASGSQQTLNSGIDGLQDYIDEFNNICLRSPNITRYSYLSNQEIRKLMRGARAYISFSKIESYGLTVAESQVAGLPLFYLEEGGTNFFKSDETSVMIPRSEIYRKSLDSRLQVYEKYYEELNRKIDDSEITSQSVYHHSQELGLYMKDCAQKYCELYNEVILRSKKS